jgi:TPR repeat protein
VNFGVCYARGIGVVCDYGEAVKLYRLAAEQGYAPGQYNYGRVLRLGRGCARDLDAAARFMKLAADQGYANALGLYAEWSRDEREAAVYFRRAADCGVARAQIAYARRCEGKDVVEAVKYYRLAALQGVRAADVKVRELSEPPNAQMVNLAAVARAGRPGVVVTKKQASVYYEYASGKRFPRPALVVTREEALAYAENVGVIPVREESPMVRTREDLVRMKGRTVRRVDDELVRKAEEGRVDAQCDLAVFVAHGRGVERDLDVGKEWLRKAADRGLDRARVYLANAVIDEDPENAKRQLTLAAGAGNQMAKFELWMHGWE